MGIFVRDTLFYRKMLALSLPIAGQQLINVGVNMADNIMLGRLGEIQMSGATLANNFIMLFQICCMGFGMGASVLVSRFWGMKDMKNLKKTMAIMFRGVFLLGLFLTVVTALFPRQIMSAFTNDEGVIEAGVRYFRISAATYWLNGYSVTTSIELRSVGKANVPLLSSVGSFFINIFFNWVFIFGNLGAPRMEVAGAALGTLLARIFEFTFIMGFFFLKDKNINMKFRDLTMKLSDLLPEYIRISVPVLISDALLGIGNSAVAVVMGHVGPVFVAANAITTVVMQMATVVIQGISQSGCIITGNTLGEGNVQKAQDQGVTFAAIGIIVGAVGAVLVLILERPIIGFYTLEQETCNLAHSLMKALALVIVFQSANSILTKGVLRGGGDTRFLMVADILFLWVVSIPLGAFLGLVLHVPGFWIFIALKADQFIKAVWCLFRLKSGKWIKKIQGAG